MARYVLKYDNQGHEMHVDLYLSRKKHFPTVVILPILGSANGKAPDAKLISWVFRLFGWSTCIAYHPEQLFKSTNSAKEFGEKIKRIKDSHIYFYHWLTNEMGVDSEKLVMWAVSFGAIIACAAACFVPGYKAIVAVMSGGPIADVVKLSEENRVKKFWGRIVEKSGGAFIGDVKAYYDLVEYTFWADAYHNAEKRTVPLLMIRTKFDKSVPTHLQDALYTRMKEASNTRIETVVFPTGHYSMIALVWAASARAHAFYWSVLRTRNS